MKLLCSLKQIKFKCIIKFSLKVNYCFLFSENLLTEPSLCGLQFCLGTGSYICIDLHFLYIIKYVVVSPSYVFQWTFFVGCSRSLTSPLLVLTCIDFINWDLGPLLLVEFSQGAVPARDQEREERIWGIYSFSSLPCSWVVVQQWLSFYPLLDEHLLHLQVSLGP